MELRENINNDDSDNKDYEKLYRDVDISLGYVTLNDHEYCIRVELTDWKGDFVIEIDYDTGQFIDFSINSFPFYIGEIISHIKKAYNPETEKDIYFIDFKSMKYKVLKRFILELFNEDASPDDGD